MVVNFDLLFFYFFMTITVVHSFTVVSSQDRTRRLKCCHNSLFDENIATFLPGSFGVRTLEAILAQTSVML